LFASYTATRNGTGKEEMQVGDGVNGVNGVNGVTVRKAYKYKLIPTTAQVCQLEETLWRCRTLYNVALEQRITLWKQHGVTLSRYEQEAELKEVRTAFPDYAAIHSHVLQDVLARLDRAYQAFFQRVKAAKVSKKAGFPRFQGRHGNRYHSFCFKEYGNGARLDKGVLVLAKIGRIAVRWSPHWKARPRP
jgi:putative transposase